MSKRNQQFAIDFNVALTLLNQNTSIFSFAHPNNLMRCQARSNGLIAICEERLLCRLDHVELLKELEEKYTNCKAQWFSESKNIRHLSNTLAKYGYAITNFVPYFTKKNSAPTIDKRIKVIETESIPQFRNQKEFGECFIFEAQDPDLLGVMVEIDGKAVAVAGCNQHGKHSAEIGVGVLESYRGHGYGAIVVSALHTILLERRPDLIALYSTQFTHINSIKVADKAGFKLDWVEINIEKTDANLQE